MTIARIFRRVAGGIAALVGVIFLVVGIFILISTGWTAETGTVQSCRAQATRTGASHSVTVKQICRVQWSQDGQVHQTSLDLGTKAVAPGSAVKIRVNGGTAAVETPAWVGYLVGGIGAVLIVGGGFALFKRSRVRSDVGNSVIQEV